MNEGAPRTGDRLLTTALALGLFATVFVVFVEPFRTDEAWFIYRARLGIEVPGMFDATAVLLRGWFELVEGLWPGLLLLRVLTLVGYGLTVWLVYLILRESGVLSGRSTAFVMAVAVATWMALNRGFEIRPEFLAHLSILAALVVGLGRPRLRGMPLVALLSLLLFVPTMFSFRFWPICFAVFFMLVGINSRLGRIDAAGVGRIAGLALGFVALALLVHVLVLDLLPGLEAARQWRESNDRQFGPLEKFRFSIGSPAIYVFYLLWAACLGLVVSIIRYSIRKSDLAGGFFLLAPIAAYYAFFFILEVKPYRYTRAIEIMVLFSVLVGASRLQMLEMPKFFKPAPMLLASLASLAVMFAAYNGISDRYHFVRGFFGHAADPAQSVGSLDYMNSPDSLLQQIATRVDYCRKSASQNVLIFRPQGHPFCGIDLGSIYNAGFRAFPDQVRFSGAERAHGNILVSSGLVERLSTFGFQCQPLGKHYEMCVRLKGQAAPRPGNVL